MCFNNLNLKFPALHFMNAEPELKFIYDNVLSISIAFGNRMLFSK